MIKPDGQVLRSVVSQPENGLYHFTWPLDSNAATGIWHIRANTGDNRVSDVGFPHRKFMPERMALNLTGEKTPLTPKDEVKVSVVGYYLYGAPANGNTLQGQLFLRPLREAVSALPGFELANSSENLFRTLDEVRLTLDDKGRGEVSTESQWKETHSPLQVIFRVICWNRQSPVTRRAEQATGLPMHCRGSIGSASKSVYDYRTDSTVKQPIVDEGSNAAFDIVYSDAQGVKKPCVGLECA
ncbi:hypothetical protein ACLK1T_20775 [Escherichia coli]